MNESLTKAFFEKTLDLARKGWGNTHPNPMVGAIIVEKEKTVAEGYHRKAGFPHAEVEAIQALGRRPNEDSSIFISLEPCSTSGRTPPCVNAIMESGIKRVYVGATDPNPSHAGRGIEILRKSGVRVEMAGIEFQKEITRLNFIFNHNMNSGSPLLALKIAETSNGTLAEVKGKPSRITEDAARADMMNWRRLFPAICVGSGTVLADNPTLTARLEEEIYCPIRLVLDSSLSTLSESVLPRNLYSDQFASKTKILTVENGLRNSESVRNAKQLGITLIQVAEDSNGRIKLSEISRVLQDLELNALYCEGGAKVAGSLLEKGLVDYLFRYRSPKSFDGPNSLLGPDLDGFSINESIFKKLGEDSLEHGFT